MLSYPSLRRRRGGFRPQVEALEHRLVPSISKVQDLGTQSIGQFKNTAVIMVPAAVTAGDSILLQVATVEFDTSKPVTVTDSAGNIYHLDVDSQNAAKQVRSLLFSAIANNPLPTGGTISVNLTPAAAQSVTEVSATEFSGPLVVDRTDANVGTSTSPSSGTAATTSNANELLLGVVGVSAVFVNIPPSTTFTPGAGYTGLTSATGTDGNAVRLDLKAEFQVVSNIGAFQADGTLGNNRDWAAALATYQAVAPLTAVPVTATVAANTTNNAISILGANFDPSGGTLSVKGITSAGHGLAAMLPGGTGVVYTPNPNFFGTDSFTYTLQSSKGGSATSTATITVLPPPPLAVADTATVAANSNDNAIAVLTNDTDPSGGTLALVSVDTPQHGTASISGAAIVYTPAPNFSGTDTFSYTIASSNGGLAVGGNTATVTITVTPPDVPTKLSLTVPKSVAGHHGLVSFQKKNHLAVVDTNTHATIRLQLSTTAGKLQIHGTGIKIKGNNSRALTLTGSLAAVNKALGVLTVQLASARARAQLKLTASDGTHTARATIRVHG